MNEIKRNGETKDCLKIKKLHLINFNYKTNSNKQYEAHRFSLFAIIFLTIIKLLNCKMIKTYGSFKT